MKGLVADTPIPPWVSEWLSASPFVVVRRAVYRGDYVPVGVRGQERHQRFAAWLHVNSILEITTPYALSQPVNWQVAHALEEPPAIRQLRNIIPVMQEFGLVWGPTGATGYQLASGTAVLSRQSDLDLVVNCPVAISQYDAMRILNRLDQRATVRLDIQLNTSLGGVSMVDYVTADHVLVKTLYGPFLSPVNRLWTH